MDIPVAQTFSITQVSSFKLQSARQSKSLSLCKGNRKLVEEKNLIRRGGSPKEKVGRK